MRPCSRLPKKKRQKKRFLVWEATLDRARKERGEKGEKDEREGGKSKLTNK